jgi:hypothetical protein
MERIDKITTWFIWFSAMHPIATLNVILALAFIGGCVACIGAMWLMYYLLWVLITAPGATVSVMGALCACGVAWCIADDN